LSFKRETLLPGDNGGEAKDREPVIQVGQRYVLVQNSTDTSGVVVSVHVWQGLVRVPDSKATALNVNKA